MSRRTPRLHRGRAKEVASAGGFPASTSSFLGAGSPLLLAVVGDTVIIRVSPLHNGLSTRLDLMANNEWCCVFPVPVGEKKRNYKRDFLLSPFLPHGHFLFSLSLASFPCFFSLSSIRLSPTLFRESHILEGCAAKDTTPYHPFPTWASNLLPIMGRPSPRLSSQVLRPHTRAVPFKSRCNQAVLIPQCPGSPCGPW